ncbi:MAG: hypothetical protein IPJ19_13000 [Planctomycetes bacterium]|nr:hypothetical protein [Planctomycetota bacterium]
MAKSRTRSRNPLSHARLVAVEALLLAAWLRSLLSNLILDSQLENWAKVLVVMGMTIGVLGGLLLWIESLTREGMKHGHRVVGGLAGGFSGLWIHALVFFGLFLLYAHMLHLSVFGGTHA